MASIDYGTVACDGVATSYTFNANNLTQYLSAPKGVQGKTVYDQLAVSVVGNVAGMVWDLSVDLAGDGNWIVLYDGLPCGASAVHGPRSSGTSTGVAGRVSGVSAWRVTLYAASASLTISLAAEF